MNINRYVNIFMELKKATYRVANISSNGKKSIQFTEPQVVGTMFECNWILHADKIAKKEAVFIACSFM